MENIIITALVSIIVLCGLIIWRMLMALQKRNTESESYQLAQKEKRFEALVENGSDCVIIISAEAKTTYVSRSIINILGYTPEEVMNMDIKDTIHPDDVAGTELAIITAIQNPGTPVPGYTARVKHKNGSWRWIEAVVTNFLHDPAINGIVDNFRDVTDRIRAEEELKETNERFFLATKGSKLGIWDYDMMNDVLIWDEAMYKIYEGSSKSFNGNFEAWLSLVHPEDRHILQQNVKKVMGGELGFDVEIRIIRLDSSIRYIRALAQIHHNDDGKSVRLIGTNMDITNNKEYELTLEQILFDISHIIRKPVTNILGLTALVEMENVDEITLRECAHRLKDAAKELDDFTIALSNTYLKKKISIKGLSNNSTPVDHRYR